MIMVPGDRIGARDLTFLFQITEGAADFIPLRCAVAKRISDFDFI